MKRVLKGCLTGVLAVALCYSAARMASTAPATQDALPAKLSELVLSGEPGYRVVAQDGHLELLLDETDLRIAIRNKQSGMLWESTPSAADEDPLADPDTVSSMHDLIQIKYFADSTMANSLGSYADCVKKEQYRLYEVKNGILAVLTLGEGSGALVNPKVISIETFENTILPALAENERAISRLKYLYKRQSLSDFSEDRKAEMLKKYPALAQRELYISNNLNKSAQKEVDRYMKEAGFTLEKMEAEYSALNYQSEEKAEPCFEIPVQFVLENGTLRVSVETKNIVYDQNRFYLHQLTLLPYFGAAGVSEEGFLLFPAGSGSLIGFNRDKKVSQPYIVGKVYGPDLSVAEDADIQIQCPLPVFGVRRASEAMLGIITGGEADAYIQAENGNILHSYAAIRAMFGVNYKISQDFYGSDSGIMLKERKPVAKSFEITYSFLNGDNANLAGMAERVRQALGMTKTVSNRPLPLFVDTLGAVETSENRLPWERTTHALTTFAQSAEILEELQEAGIGNIYLRIKAFANGGLSSYAFRSVKIEKALGTAEDLKELINRAADGDATVYPDVCLSYVTREKLFDGFSASRDTARTINGRVTTMREYDPVLGILQETKTMMLHAKAAENNFSGIRKFLQTVDSTGVSLGDMGRYVNTDFSSKNRMSRTQSARLYAQLLSSIGKSVMVDYGNAYALPFADVVVDMPVTDMEAVNGVSESVPFLQMVCFGSVEYAANSINEQGDFRQALLKCVEIGASPYFVTAYDNLIHLRKEKSGQQYYHVDYASLKEEMTDGYRFVAKALDSVRGSRMTDYKLLSDSLSVTEYSNGVAIVVNYGEEPAEYEQIKIEPCSYAILDRRER